MITNKGMTGSVRMALAAILLGLSFLASPRATAAEMNAQGSAIPAIIKNGFSAWASRDASYAVDIWRKGGLMEQSPKSANVVGYFARLGGQIGKYRSFDLAERKEISANSQIWYVAVNFDRGVVFGRFVVYRTNGGWVVQDMDFSPKPEAVMPWLAFGGQDYSQ